MGEKKFIITDTALTLLTENLRSMPQATQQLITERINMGIAVYKEVKPEINKDGEQGQAE